MAKQTLASMSVDALLKMRDDIGKVLSQKAETLKKELVSLGADYADVGRIAVYGKKKAAKIKLSALAGRKVAAKYRDPRSKATWSGRGAPTRWITEYEKQGRKREQFLIATNAKAATAKTKGKK
jgi:DNA-binding protein H-NS